MEELKKQLQEKGYTFFRMQDYPEFADEYEYYKKYICNSENNLLNLITSLRIDGNYAIDSPNTPKGSPMRVDEDAETFSQIVKKAETDYVPYADPNSFAQYWFYTPSKDLISVFTPFISKIVNLFYNEPVEMLNHLATLTYYKPGCFLKEHRDGKVGTRLCAVLIYLNDEDYNPEWGGNIVFERTESVDPIYGNIAILDFKEGNCIHEVKKVVDGYGRYAVLSFVSLGESINIPNHY